MTDNELENIKLGARQHIKSLLGNRVMLSLGQLKALSERADAEDWTPEQARAAMRELIQAAEGTLSDETNKPAA